VDKSEIRRAVALLCLAMTLAVLLLAAGCTQLPLRSLWALRQFDMETFDPAQLRAAALLPQGVQLEGEGVALDLKLERGATGEVLEQRLWMRPVPLAGAALPPAGGRQGHWVALRLSDADVARVRALREQARAWKQQQPAPAGQGGKKNSLTLKLHPQLCRDGVVGSKRLRVSAWLRWAADPGDVLMLDEADIDELWKDLPKPLPACGNPG
jgi:hypothetical protein